MSDAKKAIRRAAYLAHECGLDWGAWALGLKRASDLDWGGAWAPPQPIPDRIEDWHDPYLADCKRRGVEPTSLPLLEYHVAGDSLCFIVDPVFSSVNIGLGRTCWFIDHCGGTRLFSDDARCMSATLRRLADLVAAVERADEDGAT